MDYEKKYKEALDWMRSLYDGLHGATKEDAERYFPELKESEDEIIRQKLIKTLGYFRSRGINQQLCEKFLAWLEKQGEKNPADKIEPKFKVGDWIVEPRDEEPNGLWHIDRIEDGSYWYDKCGCTIEYADKNFHLWTIEDAKDGDVLAFDNSHIILVKESHNSTWGWRLSCWCHLLNEEFEAVEYHIKIKGLHPATKGQRDLLFQKMKEAGYEWDDNEKVLVMIGIDNDEEDERYEELIEDDEISIKQNSAWSEEDEDAINTAVEALLQP